VALLSLSALDESRAERCDEFKEDTPPQRYTPSRYGKGLEGKKKRGSGCLL
jgi:hypothetical protein